MFLIYVLFVDPDFPLVPHYTSVFGLFCPLRLYPLRQEASVMFPVVLAANEALIVGSLWFVELNGKLSIL